MSHLHARLLAGAAFCFCLLGPAHALTWPDGAKSAISLSHDDGWPTQLTQAATLNDLGFRGTFYLTPGGMPVVVTNAAAWRTVFQKGNEVGNHSYSHWSSAILATKTWVDVAGDVGANEQWLLTNIYANTPVDHTYAYPEGNYIVGPQTTSQHKQVGACEYAALLSAAVTGATAVGSGENDPNAVAQRRFFISRLTIAGDDATAFNMAKAAIDNGIAKGTWTVLAFHSLGDAGDGNAITPAAYSQIVNYIAARRSDLWVQPVVAVKNYVVANTPFSAWTCLLP